MMHSTSAAGSGKDENGRPWIYKENAVEAIEMVEPSPSAEPKRGKWVYKGKNGDWQWRADGRGSCWDEWQCDQCKGVETKMSNFCPNLTRGIRNETFNILSRQWT